MKKLGLIGAALVGATFSGAALGHGGHHGGHHGGYHGGGYQQPVEVVRHLRPDCLEVSPGVYKMRFYNEPISTSYRSKKALPIKMLLNQNCRLRPGTLQNISSVKVRAKAYRPTKLSLFSAGFESRPQMLYADYDYRRGSAVMFHLRTYQSPGKLQVFVKGDIDLRVIKVTTNLRGGHHRDGRIDRDDRRRRGDAGPGPRGPRGPKKDRRR